MPVPDPRGNGRGNGAVQLVVTDLDGTLSDAAERIHPASVRAIRDLEAAGIPVLVATGRRLRMACAVLEAGGLTGPAVVLDGALGLDLRDGRLTVEEFAVPQGPAGDPFANRVDGGTETGHAYGTYSHWNGYKLDFALSTCINNYVRGTFRAPGLKRTSSSSPSATRGRRVDSFLEDREIWVRVRATPLMLRSRR